MTRVCGRGMQWLRQALDELGRQDNFHELTLPDLFNHLVAQGKTIKVHYIHGHWLDVNVLEDIERAGDFTRDES